MAGPSVAGHVGQCLLAHAEYHGASLGRDADVAGHRHRAFDAGAGCKVVREPFHRGAEAQIVQNAGAQFRGDTAHGLHRILDQGSEGRHPCGGLGVFLGELPVQKREIHAHAGERLAQLVVDLARDAHALLLTHGFHVGGQSAQLLALGTQLLVEALALGYVARKAGGAEHVASLVENWRLEGFKPTGRALGEDGLLDVLLLAGGHHAAVVVDIALRQIFRPYVEVGQPNHIAGVRPAAGKRKGLVDGQKTPADVLQPHQEGKIVQHGAQVSLAFGQCLLGLHAGADVANDADHGPYLAAGRLERNQTCIDPDWRVVKFLMRLGHDNLARAKDSLDELFVSRAQGGGEQRALLAPDELLRRAAQRTRRQGVDVQDALLAVNHEDHVRKHLDHRCKRAVGLAEILS